MTNKEASIIGHLLFSSDEKVREKAFDLFEQIARASYTWCIGEERVGSATVEGKGYEFTIEFKKVNRSRE